MKKVMYALMAAILVTLVNACTSEKAENRSLLERVPASADFVAVGNLHDIIESAGGELTDCKLTLPNFILDELDNSSMKDYQEFAEHLEDSGIDFRNVAIFFNYGSRENEPVLVARIADEAKFKAMLKNDEYTPATKNSKIMQAYTKSAFESSYSSEYNGYEVCATKGNVVYMTLSSVYEKDLNNTLNFLRKSISDKEKFIDTPQGEYIASGNAAGVCAKIPRELRKELRRNGLSSEMTDLLDGTFCAKADLNDEQLEIEMKFFDSEDKPLTGKAFEQYYDVKARISKDALAYLGENEQVALAVSLKNFNWDIVTDALINSGNFSRSDRAMLSVVSSYLEKIDGTIAIGLGLENGLESVFAMSCNQDVMKQFSATAVVEVRKGKARGILNDLKSFLDMQQVPYVGDDDELELATPAGGLYMKAADNLLVAANHRVEKNSSLNEPCRAFDFSDYISAGALVLNKDNALMRDLNIDNDIELLGYANLKEGTSNLTFKLFGTNPKGLIARAIKLGLNIRSQQHSIENRYEAYRNEHVRRYRSAENDVDEARWGD